jgi:hypothetical protein
LRRRRLGSLWSLLGHHIRRRRICRRRRGSLLARRRLLHLRGRLVALPSLLSALLARRVLEVWPTIAFSALGLRLVAGRRSARGAIVAAVALSALALAFALSFTFVLALPLLVRRWAALSLLIGRRRCLLLFWWRTALVAVAAPIVTVRLSEAVERRSLGARISRRDEGEGRNGGEQQCWCA